MRPLNLFLLIVLALAATATSAQQDEQSPIQAPRALPGVEPEMLTPDYWIALQNNPDEVIMTPAQIEEFNAGVRTKRVEFRDRFGKPDPLLSNFREKMSIGLFMNPILPLDLPETIPGDSVRAWLAENEQFLRAKTFYDDRNVVYSDDMKNAIVENMNRDAIPDTITRSWGITVFRADVRLFPTVVPGFSETKWEMDYFQTTAVYTLEPVAVLHQSRTGDFFYVQTPIARGWVAADRIALTDRESVRDLTNDQNFLMATGDRVPVYGDPARTRFAADLYFSARLPLEEAGADGYRVMLPMRRADGALVLSSGWIASDADVHKGYLAFTKRNMLTQIFKLLDQPYGWADQQNKRDCSGTQRVLLKCFGIVTGRWPNFILAAPSHITYIDSALSTEAKIAQVKRLEPVITLAGNGGHIVMLLGEGRNGKLYYMHQAGWGYKDENGRQCTVNRVTINEATHAMYRIDGVNVYSTFRP